MSFRLHRRDPGMTRAAARVAVLDSPAEEALLGRMPARAWTVVALLVFSVVINYIDRSDLSIAAPLMQKQFSLTPVQRGSLLRRMGHPLRLCALVRGDAGHRAHHGIRHAVRVPAAARCRRVGRVSV